MKNKFLKGLVVSFALAVSGLANAGFIELDWKTANDGLLTLDDRTNLEWLDLSQTIGLNFDTVNAQLVAGGDYEGFRYATGAEYEELWFGTSYDHVNWYSSSYRGDPDETARALEIGNFFGFTYDTTITSNCDMSTRNCYRENFGLIADERSPTQHWITHMDFYHTTNASLQSYVGGKTYWTFIDNNRNLTNDTYYGTKMGSWLVREHTEVPEPSTLAVFALGLLGLASRKFKKQA